ncbi:MAG TPA: hypothetical protein VGA46_09770 [Methyloceanibacter sp.]
MRGLLPSVWLLAAALYVASLLCLIQPFPGDEAWPAPPPANETVVVKQALAMAPQLAAPEEALLVLAAVAPEPKIDRRNEWVQVAGYTTVVRSRPSAAAPPLLAYSVGRPFRVIAREAGFVRVQDLGSGQLGWIEESSLVPFFGGYRQREHQVVEPQVAVAEPQATVAKPLVAVAQPKTYAAPAKKVEQPRIDVIAARAKKEAVAVVETGERGLFKKKRDRIQRVALGGRNTGLAAMVDRAFRGF